MTVELKYDSGLYFMMQHARNAKCFILFYFIGRANKAVEPGTCDFVFVCHFKIMHS